MTTPENNNDTAQTLNLADEAVEFAVAPVEPVTPPAEPVPEAVDLHYESAAPVAPTTPAVDDTDEVVEAFVPRKQDGQFDEPVMSERTNNAQPEHITLPTDFRKEQTESMERIQGAVHVTTVDERLWAGVAEDSLDFMTQDDVARKTIEREGSQWRQTVDMGGSVLGGVFPRYKQSTEALSGDAAIMQLMQHRKLGAIYRIPLWNTGIWLTFKAPSETSLLELHRALTQDKVDLGRRSYGLSYSHTMSIYMDRVSAFALEHIHSTNLKVDSTFRLRDIISSHDLSAIVIGLASTVWPNGFNYSRSCVADPEKCRHIVEEKMSIPKTHLVDRSSLTAWQQAHMAKVQSGSVTLEEVKRYQEEMQRSQKRVVVIDKDLASEISFVLKVPTITEYVNAGLQWITELTNMVDRSFSRELSNEERNTHIIQYGQSSSMRQFGHWVESVQFNGKRVLDRETVETALATLSADSDLRVKFQTNVAEFQSSSTITVAGIPSFTCPICKKVNESSKHHPTITDVIPYDVFQTFFVALVQKIQSISER